MDWKSGIAEMGVDPVLLVSGLGKTMASKGNSA